MSTELLTLPPSPNACTNDVMCMNTDVRVTDTFQLGSKVQLNCSQLIDNANWGVKPEGKNSRRLTMTQDPPDTLHSTEGTAFQPLRKYTQITVKICKISKTCIAHVCACSIMPISLQSHGL